jgi:hypothetical protein
MKRATWTVGLAAVVLAVSGTDCRKDTDPPPIAPAIAPGGRGGSGGRAGRGGSGGGGSGGTTPEAGAEAPPADAPAAMAEAGDGAAGGDAGDGARDLGVETAEDASPEAGGGGPADGSGLADGRGDGGSPPTGGCGVAYQRCCAGVCNQPGTVCVAADPAPSPTDVCVNCGRRGDYCCAGGQCDPGLACLGFEVYGIYGRCQPCGAANQACCAGRCNGNLRCTGGGGSFGICRP